MQEYANRVGEVSKLIQNFINQAYEVGLLEPLDEYYVRNRLLHLLKLDEFEVSQETKEEAKGYRTKVSTYESNYISNDRNSLLEAMDSLVEEAINFGIIEDVNYQVEQFEAAIMDLLTPQPTKLNADFWSLYEEDPEKATDYFYSLSQANDYIKTRNIAKNIHFITPSKYGDIEITINLSKPEKDPKQIALERESKKANYPACALCMDNEGYQGRVNHAARQSHRMVRLDLNGATYGFQYSPYVYYNEHSIFLSEEHYPMSIDRACFSNLLEIVNQLPHYFVGSNTDLPIVGGSILSHDHYQGGRHVFPMEKAKTRKEIELVNHKNVKAELLNWPMSVIRLKSADKKSILDAAEDILLHWRKYTDEEADVIAYTGDTRHNTVTPIARKNKDSGEYTFDIVLRNNRTSDEYPDGIFHPHQDVQHIKKENIGLIEVMGLAILPARLVEETREVREYLQGERTLVDVTDIHRDWAEELLTEVEGKDLSTEELEEVVRQGIGKKFVRVLEDAGVYKQDEAGYAAFDRFLASVNTKRLVD